MFEVPDMQEFPLSYSFGAVEKPSYKYFKDIKLPEGCFYKPRLQVKLVNAS